MSTKQTKIQNKKLIDAVIPPQNQRHRKAKGAIGVRPTKKNAFLKEFAFSVLAIFVINIIIEALNYFEAGIADYYVPTKSLRLLSLLALWLLFFYFSKKQNQKILAWRFSAKLFKIFEYVLPFILVLLYLAQWLPTFSLTKEIYSKFEIIFLKTEILLLFLAVGGAGFIFAVREQTEQLKPRIFLKNKYSIGLGLIVLLGTIFRLWNLGDSSLWIDEVWHTYAAYMGSIQGSLARALQIYAPAPLITIISYITGSIFGFKSEFILRLPFALLGVLTIMLAYLVGQEFHNRRVGLLFAYFMSLSPIMILQSQNIRFYLLIIIFLLLILLFLYKYLRTGKRRNLYYLLLTILFALVSVPYYFLIVVPFISLSIILDKKRKLTKTFSLLLKQKRKISIIYFILFIALASILSFLFFKNYSWILSQKLYYEHSYYFKNLLIYEFPFVVIVLLAVPWAIKKAWPLYLGVIVGLSVLSIMPMQFPKYYLFLIPLLYLLSAYSLEQWWVSLETKRQIFALSFLLFLIIFPFYNLAKFNIQSKLSLDQKINLFKNPNDMALLKNYFNTSFFKLVPDPLLVKADYKKSLYFINSLNPKAVIIAESPRTIKYYKKIYNYRFIIVHPYYSFEKINQIINKTNSKVYAIVGHRIKFDRRAKIDKQTSDFIFTKMTKIKEFNALEVYSLP